MNDLLRQFRESSALYGPNAQFIEDLYEQYLADPGKVDEHWRKEFASIQNGSAGGVPTETPHGPVLNHFAQLAKTPTVRKRQLPSGTEHAIKKQSAVARLIENYRISGHEVAKNNPLRSEPIPRTPDLELAYHGLSELDLDTTFDADTLSGVEKLTLRKIITALEETYCESIGSEYTHIVDTNIKRWIKNRLESSQARLNLGTEEKIWLLKLLTAAEGIEKYLHRKYVGQKRFSLEGGESLILILDELIQRAGAQGIREVVMGMAHRGRLNVLVNILGKKPSLLFQEFEGRGSHTASGYAGLGDVKYHMGFSSDVETPGGPVHLALAFNPSHLEIIDPVVEGSVKARQDRVGKGGVNTVIPILVHGDAAFAGQGVVMETLNMAQTRAYSTAGTIHIIVNNQIGFTTSNPFDARSTLYCTDVANMIQAPVFHVNGDDPEAVLFVTQLAIDYRTQFQKDVFIDLVCYRRHGHNEADEPAVTQPMMYQTIRKHPTTRQCYAQKLVDQGVLSDSDAQAMESAYGDSLEKGEIVSRPILAEPVYSYAAQWDQYFDTQWDMPCNTAVPLDTVRAVSEKLLQLPPEFKLHARVAKIMESRGRMTAGALPLDWGYAENMAYATLLMDGHNVRITGQDVGRGTFFHRHAILYNQLNGDAYIPLKHLARDQGRPQIFDSVLSEEGVLGFEYGYSTTEPETLVIWEAQFGDFANGAQVVIDQFISSGETKWGRLSGLTMLLPHGYEGQGAEHSSARLERYLQLCSENNMQVCVPTTPAQVFHLLRRQMLRPFRKPLIVMSPKSLLRHKLAASCLEELSEGHFRALIGEQDDIDRHAVTRVVLCSGKIYYDLLEARRADQISHVAILRAEQLYPFPLDTLNRELGNYKNLTEMVWCQEEPQNQGAWYQIRHRFFDLLGERVQLGYAGRPMSAAPAVGHFSLHVEQQKKVVDTALNGKLAASAD